MPSRTSRRPARKARLLEKPLGRTAGEAYEMWQAAEAAGVKHMCAYIHRFIPALQLARTMIAAGEIGRVRHFRSDFLIDMQHPDGSLSWRYSKGAAGGGATGDLGSHHIDQARFLVGEVRRVAALARSWSKDAKGVVTDVNDDWFVAGAELEGGVTATFEASRVTEGHSLTGRIEVDGTLGTLRWEMERVSELHLTEPRKGTRLIKAVAPDHPYSDFWLPVGIQGAFAVGWRDCFYHQAHHMLAAVVSNGRSARSARRSRTATGSPRSSTQSCARPRRAAPRTWFTGRRRQQLVTEVTVYARRSLRPAIHPAIALFVRQSRGFDQRHAERAVLDGRQAVPNTARTGATDCGP